MFERFTRSARAAVIEAQRASQRLGHDHIGTEHVLLGLLPGDGLAARVLDELGLTTAAAEREIAAFVARGALNAADAEALGAIGIDLDEVRRRVEASFGRGALHWKPGRRGRNRCFPLDHVPFTPRAKKVLELSLREALRLKHKHIGTEHILLGLLREGAGLGALVLVRLGADLETVRARVLDELRRAG
jgi:ATP-dependent Clp protease ATP-binding subunit ClpA